MLEWFRKKDGSVSVYLIVIIMPIFIFQAVLIDFVRIKLAERDTESAVKAGVRSLLSMYEPSLRPYGLFARGGNTEEMEALFARVVRENLTATGEPGRFRYLDMELGEDDVTVERVYSLASHIVFRGQILEDMKYRAPVEFGIEIAGSFRKSGAADGLAEASDVFDNASSLERKWDEVNRELDESWSAALNLIGTASSLQSKYDAKLAEIHQLAERIGLNDAEEVRASIRKVEEDIRGIESRITELNKSLAEAKSLSDLAKDASGNVERVRDIGNRTQSIEQSLASARASLDAMAQRKAKLADLLEDIVRYGVLTQSAKLELTADTALLSGLYDKLTLRLSAAARANDELRSEKERLLRDAGGSDGAKAKIYAAVPVLDDAYFAEYHTASGKILAFFNGMAAKWKATNLFAGDAYRQLADSNESVKTQIQAFQAAQGPKEQQRKEQREQLSNKKEAEKGLIRNVVSRVNKVSGECGAAGGQDAFSGAYARIAGDKGKGEEGLFDKYFNLNAPASPGTMAGGRIIPDDDPFNAVRQAMSLGKRMQQLAEGLRNEAYVNEYALSRFHYRTSDAPQAAGRPLAKQETEYILYGLGSCTANYSAAYGEMFLLLFAVRLMEELADPKTELLNIGSPLLMLLTAAAKGAALALDDMADIVAGRPVPLLKKAPAFKVSYKDLLRLFLMLHSDDRKMLSRMQALIELNTGLNLNEQTAYVRTAADASFRLWFLPRFLSSGTGGLSDKMDGNRFKVKKTAVMAY